MSRRVGLAAPATVKAADQLQKSYPPAAGVQPLPAGTPGRVTGEQVGIKDPGATLSFIVIGDHGGVKDPNPQMAVAAALAQVTGAAFAYSVGDVVYFNGDASEYPVQFYEPYAHVQRPFVAIPGNHDADTTDDPTRLPLDTFMANFCASSPALPAADPQDEYGRDTQTQPYCDWTLLLDAVTIIGLYSNVPSGGHLEPSQVAWLQGELANTPTDRPLVVALHHPPYSVDAHHGGSAKMGDALDGAFVAAGRWPSLVLSGHVHDYQRFTRTVHEGRTCTYVVSGNGGYHNLHALAGDATPGTEVVPGVTFEYGDASNYGFVILTVAGGKISGSYVQVGKDGSVTHGQDSFTV